VVLLPFPLAFILSLHLFIVLLSALLHLLTLFTLFTLFTLLFHISKLLIEPLILSLLFKIDRIEIHDLIFEFPQSIFHLILIFFVTIYLVGDVLLLLSNKSGTS